MKINSKMLYRELRAALAPQLKHAGFSALKCGSLGWARPTGSGHVMFWFQSDKWGWRDNWGSAFTLEFQAAPQPGDVMTFVGRRERIGHLLEGFEELDELRLRNNSVIERLPGVINQDWLVSTLDDGTEIVLDGYKIDPEAAIYGRDLWLNYYSVEDVRAWAEYFERKLLRFVSLFENETRSEQGRARLRFHEMIVRVQNAVERQNKAAIFDEYIRIEPDQHYRSAAQHWLVELGSG